MSRRVLRRREKRWRKDVTAEQQGKKGEVFCFINDTAATEIYTLALRDALPICLIFSVGHMASRKLAQHIFDSCHAGLACEKQSGLADHCGRELGDQMSQGAAHSDAAPLADGWAASPIRTQIGRAHV